MTVHELRLRLERAKGRCAQLQDSAQALAQRMELTRRSVVRHEQALEVVRQVGLLTQQQLEYHLSEQVSLALAAVMDDPYKFKATFAERRGKTEVELLFSRRGLEFAPLGSAGGGAIDVASFALRVAYWSMRRDRRVQSVMLLDEPFAQLKGAEPNRRALALVGEISRQLQLQMLIVSDERVPKEDIMDNADRVFDVRRGNDGVSHVTAVGRT